MEQISPWQKFSHTQARRKKTKKISEYGQVLLLSLFIGEGIETQKWVSQLGFLKAVSEIGFGEKIVKSKRKRKQMQRQNTMDY